MHRKQTKGRAANAPRALTGFGAPFAAAMVAAAVFWANAGVASAGGSELLGDATCDGVLNAIDAAMVLQISAGITAPLPCRELPDVSCDGIVNAIDASLILQFDAGIIDRLPMTQPMAAPPL